MTGIDKLRSGPGMALEGKLVHSTAPSHLLQQQTAAAAGPRQGSQGKGSVRKGKQAANLHTIKTFHNIN